ncbi:hypothetical protein LJC45_04890 [Alistipes sp. OttesenSCG-928-B03]|nr:hypothetical protein [Alistipes sp. OttesenSCG-928-B03]
MAADDAAISSFDSNPALRIRPPLAEDGGGAAEARLERGRDAAGMKSGLVSKTLARRAQQFADYC